MDKHYFASKLTTDISVYVGPTFTMYVGITLFQCYHVKYVLRWPNVAPIRWPYGGPTSKLKLGQRYLQC